jgi:hypothetical protein
LFSTAPVVLDTYLPLLVGPLLRNGGKGHIFLVFFVWWALIVLLYMTKIHIAHWFICGRHYF